MKKKIIIPTVIFILLIALFSCSKKNTVADVPNYDSSYIAAIESQLLALRQEQSANNSENQKLIDELSAMLNLMLTTESITAAPPQSSDSIADDTPPSVGFTYTVNNGNATVTGYEGDEQNLVIPLSIDGYTVTAIGDSAFEDSKIKSVTLPDSVVSIGWFAFDGCTRLTAITVPSSVKKIGYGAFGSADSSLTVYCHSGSFALEYAKSYGLSYTII